MATTPTVTIGVKRFEVARDALWSSVIVCLEYQWGGIEVHHRIIPRETTQPDGGNALGIELAA